MMHACIMLYSDPVRERMNKEFLDDPVYNYETVNRASKACGPLVLWAIAQVRGPGAVGYSSGKGYAKEYF